MMVRKAWATAADAYPWSSWHQQVLGMSGSMPNLARRISAIKKAVTSLMSTLPSLTTSNFDMSLQSPSPHEVVLNELLQLGQWQVQVIWFDLIQPSSQRKVVQQHLDLAQMIGTSLLDQENATRVSTKLMEFNSRHLVNDPDESAGSRICHLFDTGSLASFLVELNHFSTANSHRKVGRFNFSFRQSATGGNSLSKDMQMWDTLGRATTVTCMPSPDLKHSSTNDICPNPSWAEFWIEYNFNDLHINWQAPHFHVDICWHANQIQDTGEKQPYIRARCNLQGFDKQILNGWPGEQGLSSAHLVQVQRNPSIRIRSSGSGSQFSLRIG